MAGNENSIHIYYCRNAVAGGMPSVLADLGLRGDVLLEAVPCSGRLDPRYMLKAFESGARKIGILACPRGQCKSMEGNLRAITRVRMVKDLLHESGLNPKLVKIVLPTDTSESALSTAAEELSKFVDEVMA